MRELFLVDTETTADTAIWDVCYTRHPLKACNDVLRRSIDAVADFAARKELMPATARLIWLVHGPQPMQIPDTLGRKAARAIRYGTCTNWQWRCGCMAIRTYPNVSC